jgi:hypothetical protein
MMKKLVIALLFMVSTNVFAEWTKIAKGSEITYYADFLSIQRKGNIVKLWILFDFNTAQIDVRSRFLSESFRHEFDCENEMAVMLQLIEYSGNMATGDVVYSHSYVTEKTFDSVPPESTLNMYLKIACSKA